MANYRAAATRYEKRDYVFNGTMTVTAIVIWLPDVVHEPSETPLALSGDDLGVGNGVAAVGPVRRRAG